MRFQDRLRATLWRCRAIVWIASWLVPRAKRDPWRSDEDRKFFHWCHFLAESGQLTPQNRLAIARACWATFPAAFWLRFDREHFRRGSRRFWGSPITFLSALAHVVLELVLTDGLVSAGRANRSSPVSAPESSKPLALYSPRLYHTRRARFSFTWMATESTESSAALAPTPCSTWHRFGASRGLGKG